MGDGFGGWLGQLVAALVAVLPLFIVPVLLKKSLDSLPGLGNQLSKLRSKAPSVGGKLKESVKKGDLAKGMAERKANRENTRQARQNLRFSKKVTGEGRFGKAGQFMATGGPALTAAQKEARQNLISSARGTVNAYEAQKLKQNTENLEAKLKTDRAAAVAAGRSFNEAEALKQYALAPNSSPEERSAAMHLMAQRGNISEIRETKAVLTEKKDKSSLAALDVAISTNAGSIISKAPDLIKGSNGAFKDITASEIVALHPSTAQAHVEHIQQLEATASTATKQLQTAEASSDPVERAKIPILKDVSDKANEEYGQARETIERALADIQNNPTLQAQFKGESRSIYERVAATKPKNPIGFAP